MVSFTTCMTGELYSALGKCTILERTMTTGGAMDRTAFHQGVARSADSGGLLHHLFGVRTLALMDQLSQEASASIYRAIHRARGRAAMPAGARVWSAPRSLLSLCASDRGLRRVSAAWRTRMRRHSAWPLIGRRLHWT